MTALVGNAFTELAKCEAEIARLEAIVADRGPGTSADRMLGWEQEHKARVLRFLATCGITP